MSINGIDVTDLFTTVFGTISIVGYFCFVFLVVRYHPKDIKQRRLKAALLVGGLPVLGMPLLLSVVLLVVALFQINNSNFISTIFLENILNWLISVVTLSACFFPLSGILAIPATFGTYRSFQASELWLNKIVPPSADEKPNVHEYL